MPHFKQIPPQLDPLNPPLIHTSLIAFVYDQGDINNNEVKFEINIEVKDGYSLKEPIVLNPGSCVESVNLMGHIKIETEVKAGQNRSTHQLDLGYGKAPNPSNTQPNCDLTIDFHEHDAMGTSMTKTKKINYKDAQSLK